MTRRPRKILIACDKFKGSVDAETVCHMLAKGFLKVDKEANVRTIPLADGGEGSGRILQYHLPVAQKRVKTCNAAGEPVWVTYQEDTTGRVFIESSRIIGLAGLLPHQKNPMQTSSYGLGLCLKKIIRKGAKDIHIFLGGSATNDGGSGMLAGMGWTFYDKNDQILHPRGGNLAEIFKIQPPDPNPAEDVNFTAWCDVDITLLGEEGCSNMFATQKGAGDEDIRVLEDGMHHFQQQMAAITGREMDYLEKGAGSAGGLGFGIYSGLNGKTGSGAAFFAKLTGLHQMIKEAELIITGEGKLDAQSAKGKVVSQVISLARSNQKSCIVVCGENGLDQLTWKSWGIQGVYSISDLAPGKEEAIQHAAAYLVEIGKDIANSFFHT